MTHFLILGVDAVRIVKMDLSRNFMQGTNDEYQSVFTI